MNAVLRAAAIVLVLALAPDARGAQTIRVDDDAPPGGDGTTWASAYARLQDALAAAPADGTVEIRIAQGAYRPDLGAGEEPGDRDASFRLADGMVVRGGYAGVGAADPDARDPAAFVTVLDGDITGTGFFGSRHVVIAIGVSDGTLLAGCTVRKGTGGATSLGILGGGGGMVIEDGAPTVQNCTFESNGGHFGGAMQVLDASPTIRDCVFALNSAYSGGAIFSQASSASIIDCVFDRNEGDGGGGAVSTRLGSDTLIRGCSFLDNEVLYNTAFPASGGAVFGFQCTTTIESSVFVGNSAWSNSTPGGGAVAVRDDGHLALVDCVLADNHSRYGGGVSVTDGSTATLDACTLDGNTAYFGGGVFTEPQSTVALHGCTLTANVAESYGGGVLTTNAVTLLACTFVDNEAGAGGGAANIGGGYGHAVVTDCSFTGNTALGGLYQYDGGGAIRSSGHGSLTVRNCTMIGNEGYRGGAIRIRSDTTLELVRCRLEANTAATYGGAISNEDYSVLDVRACVIRGNTSHAHGGGIVTLLADTRIVNTEITENVASLDGGAIMIEDGTCVVACSTVSANTSNASTGGIFGAGAATCLVENGILWGNAGARGGGLLSQVDAADVTLRFSCVEGLDAVIDDDGNTGANPQFVSTELTDYALAPESPCVDAGWNHLVPPDASDDDGDGDETEPTPRDLFAMPRFVRTDGRSTAGCGAGAIVDLGAVEHQGGTAVDAVLGDVDGDRTVGPADLAILLSAWGNGPQACLADFDADGHVGFADLNFLLARWF